MNTKKIISAGVPCTKGSLFFSVLSPPPIETENAEEIIDKKNTEKIIVTSIFIIIW